MIVLLIMFFQQINSLGKMELSGNIITYVILCYCGIEFGVG